MFKDKYIHTKEALINYCYSVMKKDYFIDTSKYRLDTMRLTGDTSYIVFKTTEGKEINFNLHHDDKILKGGNDKIEVYKYYIDFNN